MDRRDFLKLLPVGAATLLAPNIGCTSQSQVSKKTTMPSYLKGYEELYKMNPRQATIEWFRNAKFGLFIHYGLYSLLGRHEWVQYRERIPVAEYAKLKDQFTAKKFNADFITDLALEANMKYINIVTRHHDSFCLFKTKYTDFQSLNSPVRRDLVGELAESCRKKGLGLSLYYSHGRDWKHPHAPNNDEWGGNARPEYDPPEPSYAYGEKHNLQIYIDFMKNQVQELLSNYGPIASIWLDGIMVPKKPKGNHNISEFHCQELYDTIHNAQPQVILSYKQGLLGTEDYFSPERKAAGHILGIKQDTAGKPIEICDTLQPQGWGYIKADEGKHKTADDVMKMLDAAAAQNANLLLNTGPLPDGSIHPEDIATLREVGKRLKAKKV